MFLFTSAFAHPHKHQQALEGREATSSTTAGDQHHIIHYLFCYSPSFRKVWQTMFKQLRITVLLHLTFTTIVQSFAPQSLQSSRLLLSPRILHSAGGDESIESLWLMDDDDDDDDDNDDGDDGSGIGIDFDLEKVLASSPEKSQARVLDYDDDDEEVDEDLVKEREESLPEEGRHDKDAVFQDDEPVESIATLVQPQKSPSSKTKSETQNLPSFNQTVGVGRYGYNMTTLHNAEYNIKRYFPANEKVSYQIRLDLLRNYYTEHGDCNVPFRFTCQTYDYGLRGEKKDLYDITLGRWLHTIRKRNEDDPEKIRKEYRDELETMGMNWEGVGAGARPRTFRKRCKELKAFVDQNGHDRVPSLGKSKMLGIWLERQRALYRKFMEGGDCGEQLTNDRIEMLRNSGFDLNSLVDNSQNGKFTVRQSMFDEEWERMFSLLKDFKNEQGHFDVTAKLDSENFGSLLYFIAEQRHQHELVRDAYFAGLRNSKSTLTPYRFRALAEIEFDFAVDASLPSPWKDVTNYDVELEMSLLREHHGQTGQCDVTLEDVYSADNFEDMLMLYTFQQRLRWGYRHDSLRLQVGNEWLLGSDEYDIRHDLDRLGFVWSPDSQSNRNTAVLEEEYDWWEMYHDLLRYRKANGDFHLTSGSLWYSEELEDWMEEQKLKYSRLSEGSLSLDDGAVICMPEWHYLALKTVGFERDADDGPLILPRMAGRIPAVLEMESNLFLDIGSLPSDLRDISLHGKRVDKAEQLAWLVRFASLRRYYTKGGQGALSNLGSDDVSGQRLALWANNQRKQHAAFVEGKKTTMTIRRRDMLNDIGFDWKLRMPGSTVEWENMKVELIQFKETYGHCFVPPAYPRNKKLGQWILLQRQLYQQARQTYSHGLVLPTTLSKANEKELLTIGLDLTMDNLSFGNTAYDTVSSLRKSK